jgi:hypothetical protein
VPYRYGSETRKYRPDFIVLVDDGHGEDDPLHLIVEIKGYRREDAKEKKTTMETYWVPGVNNLGNYGPSPTTRPRARTSPPPSISRCWSKEQPNPGARGLRAAQPRPGPAAGLARQG